MKVAIVLSRCECQATLGAEVDENRVVLRGFARDPRKKRELSAPAGTIDPAKEQFDIGWACPICTRNVLRSFAASALSYREVKSSAAPAPALGAPPLSVKAPLPPAPISTKPTAI